MSNPIVVLYEAHEVYSVFKIAFKIWQTIGNLVSLAGFLLVWTVWLYENGNPTESQFANFATSNITFVEQVRFLRQFLAKRRELRLLEKGLYRTRKAFPNGA
jgi:hypothetical protein